MTFVLFFAAAITLHVIVNGILCHLPVIYRGTALILKGLEMSTVRNQVFGKLWSQATKVAPCYLPLTTGNSQIIIGLLF